jgi:hypothetical protein
VYSSRAPSSQTAGVTAAIPPSTPAPSLSLTALIEPPILLTAGFGSPAPSATFRSEGGDRREPRTSGVVTSVSDDLVELDLGSLDGVSQGAQVTFHGATGTRAGRLTITRVFRDRARAKAMTGANTIQAGDRVEIDPERHATALLEQIHAYRSTGDAAAARAMAERAAARAQSSAVPPELRAEILNELGALQVEDRNYAAARQSLETAQSLATGATKVRVANNLGALAALAGDRTAAENSYRLARALAEDSRTLAAERTAIDKNLETLARSR